MIERDRLFIRFRLVLGWMLVLSHLTVPVQGLGYRASSTENIDARVHTHSTPFPPPAPHEVRGIEPRTIQNGERCAWDAHTPLAMSRASTLPAIEAQWDRWEAGQRRVERLAWEMRVFQHEVVERAPLEIKAPFRPFHSLPQFSISPDAKQPGNLSRTLAPAHLAHWPGVDLLSSRPQLRSRNPQPGSVQVLQNPGFETGTWTPWVAAANATLVNDIQHSGTWAAHMGNANDAFDLIWQTIDIPADATEVSFDFWLRLQTQEAVADRDTFYAFVSDADAEDLVIYAFLWADFADVSDGLLDWTQVTYALDATELLSVTGKTVDLNFAVATDEVSDPSRAWVDDVGFYITTPGGTSPALSVTPDSGPRGTTFAISGANFDANAAVTITLDGNFERAVTGDSSGSFAFDLTPPGTISAGAHTLVAADGSGHNADDAFTIVPQMTLIADPAVVQAGDPVTVTGSGFHGGSVITVTLDGDSEGAAAANPDGSFTYILDTARDLNCGEHTLRASDDEASSASANITVSAGPLREVSITPTSAPTGTVFTITGHNFIPPTGTVMLPRVVTLTVDGAFIGRAYADSQGDFTTTYTPTNLSVGQHTLLADDGDGVAQAVFYIIPQPDCTVASAVDSGPGTLRQCLLEAKPGDYINFDPAVFPPTQPVTIAVLSPLPTIVTDSLTLDGSNAGVVLDGRGLAEGDGGLVIYGADGMEVRGLHILNFSYGIALIGGTSNAVIGGNRLVGQGNLISDNAISGITVQNIGTIGNKVVGNYIGINTDGSTAAGNGGGISIGFGATNNVIGGDSPGTGNIISGNDRYGILIQDTGTTGNQVLGNYIGTNVSGTLPVSNTEVGVLIGWGAADNIVGGSVTNAGNLISGNGHIGVIIQSSGTSGNQVLGNLIGTDVSGTSPLGNVTGGVLIGDRAQNNIVGGSVAGARNLISGNYGGGIEIQGTGTMSNHIIGNYIGVHSNGASTLHNTGDGVLILAGASHNFIGGDTEQASNIIGGNLGCGINIQDTGTSENRIAGNFIGTDSSGTLAVGNEACGILIQAGARDNVVGGDVGNLISGNQGAGLVFQGEGTTGNQVIGNLIGTDVTGMNVLGNTEDGIAISFGASNNLIGGTEAKMRNLISGNSEHGIRIQNAGSSNNQIIGNYIGTNINGTAALGNHNTGIVIMAGAASNIIGSDTDGAGNLISGNAVGGIYLQGSGTDNNQVLGNYVGTDYSGMYPLSNGDGIVILGGASSNMIGGISTNARNLISGNMEQGIQIQSTETISNQVLGNYIGTNISGTAALGNKRGIAVLHAQTTYIGGEMTGTRNLISGNSEEGIRLQGARTTLIRGNYIGLDVNGTQALGNGADGIALTSGATHNIIGGTTPAARNLIGGNLFAGIWLQDEGTRENQVLGNYIGTDVSGAQAVGNDVGVELVAGAADNTIGGTDEGARNVISGNNDTGVWLQDAHTDNNQIIGNYIGTTTSGNVALGNKKIGIMIGNGAANNIVGGDTENARNIISGQTAGVGVWLQSPNTTGNRIMGNYIGTDAAGTISVANAAGIVILGQAAQNTIGGQNPGEGNVISGNLWEAIGIADYGTTGNYIIGNIIGANAIGNALGNGEDGLHIIRGANENVISHNQISYNARVGIWLVHNQTSGNVVSHNDIMSNTTHGIYLGDQANANTIGVSNTIAYNGQHGVVISGTTTLENRITRNSIYDNGEDAIAFVNIPVPAPTAWQFAPTQCSGSERLQVSGYACASCQIEVYGNPAVALQGTRFLAATEAGGDGQFSVSVPCEAAYPYLAATATRLDNTTLGFFGGRAADYRVFLPVVVR